MSETTKHDVATEETGQDESWGAIEGLSANQKKSYLTSLYVIACVDGDFDESEQLFLFTVAQQMDLSPDEFEESLPDGEIVLNDVKLDAPEEEELRVAWLRNLILMVAADGVLTPAEYQTCMYFSEQLGFAPAVVDDVLMNLKR